MRFLGAVVAFAAVGSVVAYDAPQTTAPPLAKRYQKVRLPKSTVSSTKETPKPWVRVIYDDVREIITPTVVASVTFYAKPPENTDMPHPWVSLDRLGLPKTIKPEVKNGKTKNASPTYSTYFQTATTVHYNYEDLKAHNMDPGSTHEEVEFIPEDDTYVSLNPLIRCTPERYQTQGIARDKSSEPFCTPHENVQLAMGKTYFFTWYTRFFGDDNVFVRLHFTYVKENAMDKGMKKRETEAFFSTPWIENLHGFYAFEIEEDWLLGEWLQNVAVSIQPQSTPDEEFDLLEHATTFKIGRGTMVGKNTKESRAKQDKGITDDTWYYIVLSIPSVICVTGLVMYLFIWLTRGDRDISVISRQVNKSKHKILGKFRPKKSNKMYSELPQFDTRGGNKRVD